VQQQQQQQHVQAGLQGHELQGVQQQGGGTGPRTPESLLHDGEWRFSMNFIATDATLIDDGV
jgi:hypothetical protein